MRIELAGWAVVIAPGWTTVIDADQRRMRLFHDAHVENDYGGHSVSARGAEIGLERIAPEATGFEAHADVLMSRHVRQGSPELSLHTVAGRAARTYGWTDGIQNIESTFVDARHVAGLSMVRIDVALPGLLEETSEVVRDARSAAAAVLDSLSWR